MFITAAFLALGTNPSHLPKCFLNVDIVLKDINVGLWHQPLTRFLYGSCQKFVEDWNLIK